MTVGGGWVTDNAADWNVPAPAALKATRSGHLNIWLELVVDEETPVIMYFGDSISSGVSARLGVYDSWPNKHALAHGHIATHYTNSGTKMEAHLDPALYMWHRYDTAENLAKPDGCWFAMGSNDIFGGATFEQMLDRFDQCLTIIENNFTHNIGAMTVKARHDSDSPDEPTRKAWNEYLLTTAPERVVLTADPAALMIGADGNTLDKKYTASDTDIHFTAAGYSRFMQAMPPLHR